MHLEKPSEITLSLCVCAWTCRGFGVFMGARGALLNIKPQTIKTTAEPSWEYAKGSLCGFRGIRRANSFNEAALLHMQPGNDKFIQVRITADRYWTSNATEWMCCAYWSLHRPHRHGRDSETYSNRDEVTPNLFLIQPVRKRNLRLDLLKA